MFEQLGPELAEFVTSYPTLSIVLTFVMLAWRLLGIIEKGFARLVIFVHRMRLLWRKIWSEPDPNVLSGLDPVDKKA